MLWLSPVYRSPQVDNGYDISDYHDIDPVFGTLGDFDRLLAGVHERGMRLVMDLVVNHTSDEHPWFVESRSSRDNPKRDWYWVARGPGRETTEQLGFDLLRQRVAVRRNHGRLLPAPVLAQAAGPELGEPAGPACGPRIMNWWLDRGVDGFRMDVINMVSKLPDLPDGQLAPGGLYGDGGPYFRNGPRLHEFLQEMDRAVFADRSGELLTVGETPG